MQRWIDNERSDSIWSNLRLRSQLNHYYALVLNNNTPLYLRCRTIPVEIALQSSTDALWEVHQKIKAKFEAEYAQQPILSCCANPILKSPSFLDLKIELSHRILQDCIFCENKCHKNRTLENIQQKNNRGFCGVGETSFISSIFLHMGEEAPLIPSGTIFFSGCTFNCCFCQNSDISTAGKQIPLQLGGSAYSAPQVARLADELVRRGALNINYVGGDPTPNIHTILQSMNFQTHNRCQLWNSNFFNSIPALDLLSNVMDLWLPDFKYGNNECARKYSHIQGYWDVITRNFLYIHDHGTRNIIIRHLVLPDHIECCTRPILRWIADHVPEAVVNIMAQYHPDHEVSAKKFPELNRRPSKTEMEAAYSIARELNLEYASIS